VGKSFRWVHRITGDPEASDLHQLIINLLLTVAFLMGSTFLVSDAFLNPELVRIAFDVGMMGVFGTFYWLSRFRRRYRFVTHGGTVAALIFFTTNFFVNSGIVGPTLMVILMVLAFVTIVHTPRVGLAYFLTGAALSVLCLIAQKLHPEWIAPYTSQEVHFWDVTFTFVFCLAMVFFVMQTVMRFFRHILDRTQRAQAAVDQSEKMAALGELLATLGHEIKNPVAVISSALSYSQGWWRDEFPKTPGLLAPLSREQIVAFWLLLSQGLEAGRLPSLDRRTDREKRGELVGMFSRWGWGDAAQRAEDLTALNLVEWDPRWEALVADEGGRAVFRHALRSLTVDRSNLNAQTASGTLQRLVQALGLYSRTDNLQETPRPIRLIDGLETVLTLYGAAHKNTVEIVKEFDDHPMVIAKADELIQVWTNLVQNALQAMHGEGTLTVSVRKLQAWVRIAISDTGPGVPPGLREKIFAPFFTTKEPGLGTGLGLGVVMRIVTASGGTVEVLDAPGGGACFVVLWPRED